MKINPLSILLPALFFSTYIHAQNKSPKDLDTASSYPADRSDLIIEDSKVFTVVEQMPVFPGGQDSLFAFLLRNYKCHNESNRNSSFGHTYITFIINSEGKLINPKILKGIGGKCDIKALNVLKMLPDWTPGQFNGKAVNVQYNVSMF